MGAEVCGRNHGISYAILQAQSTSTRFHKTWTIVTSKTLSWIPRRFAIRKRCAWTICCDTILSAKLALRRLREQEQTRDRHTNTKKTKQRLPTVNGNRPIINTGRTIFGSRSVAYCQMSSPMPFFRSLGFWHCNSPRIFPGQPLGEHYASQSAISQLKKKQAK